MSSAKDRSSCMADIAATRMLISSLYERHSFTLLLRLSKYGAGTASHASCRMTTIQGVSVWLAFCPWRLPRGLTRIHSISMRSGFLLSCSLLIAITTIVSSVPWPRGQWQLCALEQRDVVLSCDGRRWCGQERSCLDSPANIHVGESRSLARTGCAWPQVAAQPSDLHACVQVLNGIWET